MVELQGSRMLVEATQDAATPSLFHESPLQRLPPFRNSRGATPATAETTFRPCIEHSLAMSRTPEIGPLSAFAGRPPGFPDADRAIGFQAQLAQPVPDRRTTGAKCFAHLLDRSSSLNQRPKTLWVHFLVGRVRFATICRQPVLLQPVADRRFVFADALADRFERQALSQALFEQLFVHTGIIANASDRTMQRRSR